MNQKKHDFQGLKLFCQEDCSSSSDTTTSSTKAITASYAISHVIAKSKSFTDGEFVKECLIVVVVYQKYIDDNSGMYIDFHEIFLKFCSDLP